MHPDRGEAPRILSETPRDVLVVVRQRHEHGAVDAGALHLGEQRLDRRLGVGREEVRVHVAREPLRHRGEDVRVRVDDGHDASRYRRAASA